MENSGLGQPQIREHNELATNAELFGRIHLNL